MNENHTCRARTLAEEGPIRIDLCSCGQIHLTMGPLTIRLCATLVSTLSDSLRSALAQLDRRAPVALQ